MRLQNSVRRSSRCSGLLPAMMAALMAPMETPETQSGSMPGLVQRLIDARLIGAQRAAALQHQGDAAAALRPPANDLGMLGMKGFCIRPWPTVEPDALIIS